MRHSRPFIRLRKTKSFAFALVFAAFASAAAQESGGGEASSGGAAGLGNFSVTDAKDGDEAAEGDGESGAASGDEGDAARGSGVLAGRVVGREAQEPLRGVAVLLDGTERGTITNAEGAYRIEDVAGGTYTVKFVKNGFVDSSVTEVAIPADGEERLDFAMPPKKDEVSGDVYELQNFTVTAEEASQLMQKIDLRMEADQIMDVMGAEDFSKYAASDVGEAIKRVAGVTVEGGKFAVIRGLDERYSSTTLNSAPVPSPNPDRQSPPLDLFPSDVVGNLTLTKTFAPELPGNSAGGSIDIRTNVYPEDFEINYTGKAGFNDNAEDRFLTDGDRPRRSIDFDNVATLDPGRFADPSTDRRFTPEDESVDPETDFAIDGGGTFEVFGRSLRVFASGSRETDFQTSFGQEEERFADGSSVRVPDQQNPIVLETGGLAKGELPFTTGRFDFTESTETTRTTFLLSGEMDLDREGDHSVGATVFDTSEDETFANLRENGFFPGKTTKDEIDNETNALGLRNFFTEDRGGLSELLRTDLLQSTLVETEREMTVYQLRGDHTGVPLPGAAEWTEDLDFSWTLSSSETEQTEFDAFTVGAMRLPSGEFLGGQQNQFRAFEPTRSWRRIQEEQDFGRFDLANTFEINEGLVFTPRVGSYHERTERDTDQLFLTLVSKDFQSAGTAPTFEGAVDDALSGGRRGGSRPEAVAEGARDIDAFYTSGKLEVNDWLELIGGVRFESFQMQTGTNVGGDDFFNSDILRDTSNPSLATPRQAKLNTQILGINGGRPLSPDFEGEIDEDLVLPSISAIVRPIEGMRATLAYSQTNVRPSFKEFTFITVQDPVSLDFESGNPALTTSDVESIDARLEYTWNEGDLVAVSLFHKTIDEPIEKTTLAGSERTEIFFNNPNSATVQGVEFQFRKKLDFIGPDFAEYFSLGGNFALIDASVDVPEAFQQLLSGGFPFDENLDGTAEDTVGGGAFAVDGDTAGGADRFEDPPEERRLFQQPEWIVNGDISFEHPDWGTEATLSVFGQSKVLETAGGFIDSTNTNIPSLATVDEFRKSYYEVNFTFSQKIGEHFEVGFSVENLTDSERGIERDDSVDAPDERSFRVGRDYSFFVKGKF